MLNEEIKEVINVENIIKNLKRKDTPQRYCFFIFGIFLSALTFNIFFAKNNIVTGGVSGLSIIFNFLFNIDESKFVLYSSLALLVLCLFTLGLKATLKNIVGTLLYPLFIKLTSYLVVYFNIESSSMLLLMLFAGLFSGIATSIMMKTGYTTGGFNILYQIFNKYLKISIGNSSLILNSSIILCSVFVFGLNNAIYAVIALYISSFIADRFILGTSRSKTFYIITDKDELVKEYIINKLNHGVTLVNVKGGLDNDRKKMLMCVVPTKEYYNLREVVLAIDEDAFFLITDSYEVCGAI